MPVHDPFTLVLTRHSPGLSVRRGDRTYLETEAKPNAFPRMQSIGFSEPGGKRQRTRANCGVTGAFLAFRFEISRVVIRTGRNSTEE